MLRSTLLIACIAGPLLFSLAPAANSQGTLFL